MHLLFFYATSCILMSQIINYIRKTQAIREILRLLNMKSLKKQPKHVDDET